MTRNVPNYQPKNNYLSDRQSINKAIDVVNEVMEILTRFGSQHKNCPSKHRDCLDSLIRAAWPKIRDIKKRLINEKLS